MSACGSHGLGGTGLSGRCGAHVDYVNSQGLVNDQTNRWVLLVNVVNRQTGSTHIVGPARQLIGSQVY